MRILHIDTATEWRGGQNQILLTAEGQAVLGHQARILANERGELSQRAVRAGLDVHAAPMGRGDLSWRTIGAVGKAARAFAPDVIHVHESHGVLGALLCVRDAKERPRLVASRRVDFPIGRLAKLKYERMDRILAVSQAVRSVLLAGGLSPEKVFLVHEGVKDREPAPGGFEAMRSMGIPEGAPVVGNVAQLVDHKDHATLLQAAAQVLKERPECRFLICGDGPLKEDLMKLASALGIAERVLFAGFRSDLDALVPCFDVFCLSSHLEGLGTSVLDAMCFARPVVATRAGGIPDAVADGETGRLVPPRDYQALARALLDTLNSNDARARYGHAGRKRFLSDLTSSAMVEATLRAYA